MFQIEPIETRNLDEWPDDAFRSEVRQFLATHYPPELRFPPRRLHFSENKPWYMALAKAGWLTPGWPRQYGGLGLSAGKQLILIEEYERHGCARLNDMGMTMIGPLLIKHGSVAQQEFFLPKILSGAHIWAQGYSEPNAGSDLAALRCEAVADGADWIITGQKTWTTLANDANWIFLLVRTDKSGRKQEGISCFLVDMNLPGITVRPIINLELHDEFCEVFFDQVRVSDSCRVGALNQGWAIAKNLLGFERIYLGSPRQSEQALDRLKLLGERMNLTEDAFFIDRFTRLQLDLEDLKCLFSHFADQLRRGETLGADVSMLKLFQSELYQRITEAMMEFAGEFAGLLEPMGGNRELHPGGAFIAARPTSIYGGTNEIQRNILAKNVLDMPG